MGALETYLQDLRDTKLSGEGVSELSYYPALRNLLEEVGGGLKPKVRCLMNLKNRGAGLPRRWPVHRRPGAQAQGGQR